MKSRSWVDERARDDSKVVWPRPADTFRGARILLIALVAVVAIIGLIDVLVGGGSLDLIG